MASAIVTVILTGLLVLNANMVRLLGSSTETTNASTHLQTRVEQIRLANWNQLSDPNWVQNSLLKNPTDADVNLPGLSESYTVAAYTSPCTPPASSPTPPPFTVIRQADGTVSVSPAGYSSSALLVQQEMLQVDVSITWPGLGRTRSRMQTTLVSPWGVSK